MRPAFRHAALAAACVSALVLGACGKHVASNAPITFAPADTPYLFANFKAAPEAVTAAWNASSDTLLQARLQQLQQAAQMIAPKAPEAAKILDAMHAELANVHSEKELVATLGFSRSALGALYGIGDVPVLRMQLASPSAFQSFWSRVEKRAGVTAPTATIDKQTYRTLGGADAKMHFIVAIEGDQLVVTVAPAHASPALLKQLLGLTKPASDASDKLARIDSKHGYTDYGSGYIDLPRLFANIYDGKNAATQEFIKDLGGSAANPACASEFQSLSQQVPLISAGTTTYTAKQVTLRADAQLSSTLAGALTALKQPVPGMDAKSDDSMFDMVLALPLQKWQAFIQDRAKAAAGKTYQCPALASLNDFAKTAANPPVQMPPEAASLLGVRMVLDKWDIGPQIAARVLVASSNPAELAQKIQQTLPQFALKTISTDGKPVAFELPQKLQVMLGSGNQGWIAANKQALVAGVGTGADARLDTALNAPAGDGNTLMRMHMDGKMYPLLASWLSRIAAAAPAASQADVQSSVATLNQLGKITRSADASVTLDNDGLHMQSTVMHN